MQLLDDLKETRRYWKLKEEAQVVKKKKKSEDVCLLGCDAK
jgi:hypothetical protein